jgi:hypothetical protein
MLRTALACCALLACKGSPPEDERAPAQAPMVPPEPADAGFDAPSAPCYAIPFKAEAERAGIRRLAHRVPPSSTTKPPTVRGVVKLVVGKQTVVPRLRPSPVDAQHGGEHAPRPQVRVPAVANADGLIVRSDAPTDKVTVNALAYLEGAVVEVAGDGFALVAIGDAGIATLARYREHYVKPRLAAIPSEGADTVQFTPLAIMLDDLDGDGVPEQVSFSRVGFQPRTPTQGTKAVDSEVELGVLWSTGEFASVRICCDPFDVSRHYVVPPTLSGGNVLLVATTGDRIVLDGKNLTRLPADPVTGENRCLQTSTTEPATIIASP